MTNLKKDTTNLNQNIWEEVKKFYKDKFGFEPNMVDLIVDLDIVMMCARGASNKSICDFLKIAEDDVYTPVTNAIDRHLGFSGWASDLPFNPKKIYDGLDTKDIESYRNMVVIHYGYVGNDILDRSYNVAVLASRLEKLTNENWI